MEESLCGSVPVSISLLKVIPSNAKASSKLIWMDLAYKTLQKYRRI